MKTAPATFVAMIAGWAIALLGFMFWSSLRGDVRFMAFWTGVFALIGWGLMVLPLMLKFGKRPLFANPAWSWASWAILGLVAYGLLVFPLLRWHALYLVWYPAVMGASAGMVYGLLRRSLRRTLS